MYSLSVKSPAKINLYLDVINKRTDNYHNILTLFERISLFDRLCFKVDKKSSGIKLSCNNKDIPSDSTNLIYRAAELLREAFCIRQGLDIRLIKHIPVGSGLGGASSNAASTLEGLNKLYKLGLSQNRLLRYGRILGADVSFFLLNKSFALAKEKGDKFLPTSIKQDKHLHILVVPKVKVLTKDIYAALKVRPNKNLTNSLNNVKVICYALNKKDYGRLSGYLQNSLEEPSLRQFPVIKRVKIRLKKLGAKTNLMSGSGPAVFSFVNSRKEALELKRKLHLKKVDVFIVKTV